MMLIICFSVYSLSELFLNDRFPNSQCENENAEFTEGSGNAFMKGRLKRNWNLWIDNGA